MTRVNRRARSVLAIMSVLVAALAMSASANAKTVVYNNIVEPLPGNFASIGYAATSTAEYGGLVELAGTARKNPKVTVAMSSWACKYGNVTTETCTLPKPNQKFKWPLTLNLYNVGPGDTVGSLIATDTHTFAMPYRPTVSRKCAGAPYDDPGAWYDETSNSCYHGLAFTVHFAFPSVTLPSQVIASVAYNTSNYGASPAGDSTECYSSPQGCPYDSLNVSVVEPAENGLTVGQHPTETQFVNSNWPEMYCGSSATLDTFSPADCPSYYEGDQPAFKIEAGGM